MLPEQFLSLHPNRVSENFYHTPLPLAFFFHHQYNSGIVVKKIFFSYGPFSRWQRIPSFEDSPQSEVKLGSKRKRR